MTADNTDWKRTTYWCEQCKVPLLSERCDNCGADGVPLAPGNLRPVFAGEREFIAAVTGSSAFVEEDASPNWGAGRYYYRDGCRVARVGGTALDGMAVERLSKSPRNGTDGTIDSQLLSAANATALAELEHEATGFIRRVVSDRPQATVAVSFSGGKDSVVTSHLVRSALGNASIPHLFADTTIEMPETYGFIEALGKEWKRVPLLRAQPNVDFYALCEQIGPPSRIQRWCCSTHKMVPLQLLIDSIRGEALAVTFVGVRAMESRWRAKFPRVSQPEKIGSEVVARPILNWTDSELWIYALAKQLPMNPAYAMGFLRIGCSVCPANSSWSNMLLQHYHPGIMSRWEELLTRQAERIGHTHPEEYVAEGQWRARAAGRDIPAPEWFVNSSPCERDASVVTYTLGRSWHDSFWEYMKPIGSLRVVWGNPLKASAFLKLPRSLGSISMEVTKPRDMIRVDFAGVAEDARDRLMLGVETQVRKFQLCLLCGACKTVCPVGAISVGSEYRIDSEKCTHCWECIFGLRNGCIAAESLRKPKKVV